MVRQQPHYGAVIVIFLTVLLVTNGTLFCQKCNAADKKVITTKYTTLVFQSEKDVAKFSRQIDFKGEGGFGGFFSSPSPTEVRNNLIVKIDALFERVQRILDMRKQMQKVRIQVYSSYDVLSQAYYQQFRQKCNVRAWYVYERNTIYINVDDVHEGMLAHEIAHAIIDHYLAVRPPRASAEILARYVDEHLFDEIKNY